MALPSSGILKLTTIAKEVGHSFTENVSLGGMSDTAGFSAPDKVSDFYNYSHISTGLTSALYTQDLTSTTSWDIFQGESEIATLSDYDGREAKLVIQYINGTTSTSYRGDFQIGATIIIGETTYDLSQNRTGWSTSTNDSSTYSGASFNTLSTGGSGRRWNVSNQVPGSSGTGTSVDETVEETGYHVYAETSSPATNGTNFWLTSPTTELDSSSLEFSFVSFGSNVGTFKVYLDIIS